MSLFKKKKQRLTSKDTDNQNDNEAMNSTDTTASDDALKDMPLTEHLVELRSHLIKIMVVVAVIF